MYTLEKEENYNNSLSKKYILLHDEYPCCRIEGIKQGIKINWNGSDEYLPMQFTYTFLHEITPLLASKIEYTIKNKITYLEIIMPFNIENHLLNGI